MRISKQIRGLKRLLWLQMTFPIRPDRVQDSSSHFVQRSPMEIKLAEPSSPTVGPAGHAADLSVARAPGMPSPGSRLPPLSGGRPKQVPEDYLYLFGKKGGKLPVGSA